MPLSLLQSIVRTCVAATKPERRRRSAAGLRSREASMRLESLEQRMALTVAAPSIRLAAASDTGLHGDWTTSVTRPVFMGTAPARSSVVVYADGTTLLGVATANARGAWSLATPVDRPLESGPREITAQAFSTRAQVWSTVTKKSVIVDPAPTASLSYDSHHGRATLTFSEPVSGVQAANLRLSGRTELGLLTNVSITDPRARALLGSITMTPSENDTKFTFQEERILALSGQYTLSFLQRGVVDRVGNPLAKVAAISFSII